MPFITEKCYVLIKLFLIFLRFAKLWPWMAYYASEEEKILDPNVFSISIQFTPFLLLKKCVFRDCKWPTHHFLIILFDDGI